MQFLSHPRPKMKNCRISIICYQLMESYMIKSGMFLYPLSQCSLHTDSLVVRGTSTVSGSRRMAWSCSSVMAIVNGGSVSAQANYGFSCRDWTVNCSQDWSPSLLPWTALARHSFFLYACSWSWWSTKHQDSCHRRFQSKEVQKWHSLSLDVQILHLCPSL